MGTPVAQQPDMKNNDEPATELAVAKTKVKLLQKQVNELKHVKTDFETLKTDVQTMVSSLLEMDRRRALDGERQCFRQEMLFNSIKVVAEEVQQLKHHVRDINDHIQHDSEPDEKENIAFTPGSAKKTPRSSESFEVKSPGFERKVSRAYENRRNFERVLDHHVQLMNNANTITELQESGKARCQVL